MLEAIIKHLKRFRSNKRGISNVLVVLLSLILVVVIVANVVLWSYQMNQLDWEKMQENLQITNVERYFSWFTSASEYILENGSKVGGTYRDTWDAGGTYETFKEGMLYKNYYPNTYQMTGSTRYVSGSLSDLQNDDSIFMQFRSYVSASSAMSKTNALIAYRSSTGAGTSLPKYKIWTGNSASLSSEIGLPSADSPVRWVRTAYCPIQERSYEVIIMTISDDRYYDLYIWNGARWLTFNNIGYHTGTTFYRGFDVAYEHSSGRALIVYSRGTTTNEIGYRIWDGSSLSQEYTLDLLYTTGIVYWINLAICSGTRLGTADDNEIAMIYIDANIDICGYVWTGSAWSDMGATAVWDATAAIATEECIAVAYEQLSGRAMFVWGDAIATDNYYRIWNGATLSSATLLDIPAQGGLTNWVTLRADPNSNGLLFLVVDAGSDLNTAYWDGSTWVVHIEHDAAVDTHAARCADFAWNPVGSTGLLVWGTTTNSISRRTFTPPNTWGTTTTASAAGTHPWVQLHTNPRFVSGDKYILGADLNSNFDIGIITWDGTTFTITEGVITADTTVTTYECFEIAFMNFGEPTEFTTEIEFTGTSDAENWTQLTWTIDSSFTTNDVNATFQLYNYTAGRYSTSGDGYGFINSIIGITEATKNQTVNVNPTDFRNATTGEWKVKIKCVKATSTPFDWKADYIELKVTTQSSVYSLGIVGNFVLNTPITPENISSVEIHFRFRASDVLEDWLLNAYNWTNTQYDEIIRMQPTTEFNYYTVNLTETWQSYINANGTIKLKLCDALSDANQTIIDIDFLAFKITSHGTLFTFKNNGASTLHIVSIWVITANFHKRYDADFFLNSGETTNYPRTDIYLPSENFTVKVVTERGNMAVFTGG